MANRPGKRDMPNANPPESGVMSDAEKSSLVAALVEELGELFEGYIGGEVEFDEVTFELFDTLQTLHAIANNSLLIEYFDEDDEYDEFDELAGEPTANGANGADGARTGGKSKGKGKGQRHDRH